MALDRAVVLSMTEGPESAWREVVRLESNSRLVEYHYLSAIKADLLKRMGQDGQDAEATRACRDAMQGSQNTIERAAMLQMPEPRPSK